MRASVCRSRIQRRQVDHHGDFGTSASEKPSGVLDAACSPC